MQMIKYVLLFFIFILSFKIGRLISKKYVDRVNELKDMKNALNIFKSKIKFTYEPIGEVFLEISKTMGNNGEIFNYARNKMKTKSASLAWEEAVEESKNNLIEEDKQTLKMLSKLLRTNWYRRSNKPNRDNTALFTKANRSCTKRKKQKWEVI